MFGTQSKSNTRSRLRNGLLALAVSALAAPAASAGYTQAPSGYDAYLTYIMNGVYNPATPHPVVPGCSDGVCDGNYFHTVIQKRTPAQVAALETQAKAFFKARFGIDVDHPANAGRVVLLRTMADPRAQYRAYVISDMYVPREGFVVYDSSFVLAVIDPNGYTLTSGEFAGQTINPGSAVNVGEYRIEVKHGGRVVDIINIAYRSSAFVSPDANGRGQFACEIKRGRLDQNHFANPAVRRDGLAQGVFGETVELSGGRIKENIRNTLTFGGIGGI